MGGQTKHNHNPEQLYCSATTGMPRVPCARADKNHLKKIRLPVISLPAFCLLQLLAANKKQMAGEHFTPCFLLAMTYHSEQKAGDKMSPIDFIPFFACCQKLRQLSEQKARRKNGWSHLTPCFLPFSGSRKQFKWLRAELFFMKSR